MKSFINVQDIGPLDKAMAEAFEIKNDRYKYQHLGKNKTPTTRCEPVCRPRRQR